MGDNGLSYDAAGIAMGVLFACIGGFLIYDQQQAVIDTERIEATVVGTEVQDISDENSDTDYYPVVEYRYTYEGQQYTNDNVFPGLTSQARPQSRAEEIANEYEPGDTATVYVDPENPSESFLIHETTYRYSLLAIGAGLVTVLVYGYSLVKEVL